MGPLSSFLKCFFIITWQVFILLAIQLLLLIYTEATEGKSYRKSTSSWLAAPCKQKLLSAGEWDSCAHILSMTELSESWIMSSFFKSLAMFNMSVTAQRGLEWFSSSRCFLLSRTLGTDLGSWPQSAIRTGRSGRGAQLSLQCSDFVF